MLSTADALRQWPGRGNHAEVEPEPSTVFKGLSRLCRQLLEGIAAFRLADVKLEYNC
jgi:hypothetical protein